MRMADWYIRKASITEVMSRDGSNKFSQAAGQLTKFQEEVEEIAEALQVAGSALVETEEALGKSLKQSNKAHGRKI